MRDFQRQKVYDWEATLKQGNLIPFARCQAYVNDIWEKEGLKFPPKVVPMANQTKKWSGKATRHEIFLPERGATEHTLLHEMAHSMTMPIDGECPHHGPVFVGVAMTLYEKYLEIPKFLLWFTAERAGVKFEKFAKPTIIDD